MLAIEHGENRSDQKNTCRQN